MRRRKLGQSSIEISELSLGCMSLPTNTTEAQSIIEAALDAGINYFDTADLYQKGLNEKIVGEHLKSYRDQIVLATKVGNRWNEHEDGWSWDPSPKHIKEGLKESLRRLKTDYIDVYQLHGGTSEDPWEEIIETFNELKKEGYIREYGISSIRPNVFRPFLKESEAISNMMQYSVLDRRAEEWFDSIQECGASVVTRGSIAKGLLTNQWQDRIGKTENYMSYTKTELINVLEKIQKEYEDVHAAAIAFNLSHPSIASTVIGASSRKQLLENVQAYEKAKTLQNIEQMARIAKLDQYNNHR